MEGRSNKNIFQRSGAAETGEPKPGSAPIEQSPAPPPPSPTPPQVSPIPSPVRKDGGTSQDLLNALPVSVITVDLNGLITFMNQRAQSLSGKEVSQCIGKRSCDVFPMAACDAGQCCLEEAMATGNETTNDTEFGSPEGLVYARVTATPLRDDGGSIIGGIQIFTDISRGVEIANELQHLSDSVIRGDLKIRVDAERFSGNQRRILQEVNNTLESVVRHLDSVPVPLMIMDRSYVIRYVNDSCAKLMNATPEEVIGNKCFDHMKTDDCHTERCACALAMKSGRSEVSISDARPGGRQITVSSTAVPIADQQGEIIGALEVLSDQTDIKVAQDILSEAHERLDSAIERFVEFATNVGTGNLSEHLDVDSDDTVGQLAKALNNMVENMADMSIRVRLATAAIATCTNQITTSTTQQAASTSEQASAVSETSATVSEVRQTADHVADKASQVAVLSQDSLEVADSGLKTVDNTIEGMKNIKEQVSIIAETILELGEQTQQIGKIIDTVNDIADQSNLLALNAAIEAARAGDAGRGFAVVAGEVRNLAQQSREATTQVREILGEIQKAANSAGMVTEEGSKRADIGMNIAEDSGDAIRAIINQVQQVSDAARQIAASAKQQVVGMDQVSSAMESINQAAMQSEAGVRQVEGTSRNLDSLAKELSEIVEQYQTD